MDLLAGLNLAQQMAVSAGPGPVLVIAGPGSGKTRVLTHRIAYLMGMLGVRPANILAMTFTNKAAAEMKERARRLSSERAGEPFVGTFHSFCARVLRMEGTRLGLAQNFVIYDSDDQLNLVKLAVKELNLDDKQHRPAGIHASISNAKNELLEPQDYPIANYRDEVVRKVYARYQQLLLANNAVDFDDLLVHVFTLLSAHPDLRMRYSQRYEHVLVDEFQDTNIAQYNILRLLSDFHRNIFIVGDVDQSIYGWRGAEPRNVQTFLSDYPDAQVIKLEENYRSTQTILDAATAVIRHNPDHIKKDLLAARKETGGKLLLRELDSDQEEAQYVVDKIATLVRTERRQPGDFAVMYRTNAQSRLLEEAFVRANLPYRIVGAQRFYGRREVKDVLAYLRLAHNPRDEISLLRVINVPARGLGDKSVQTLIGAARQQNLTAGELLQAIAKVGIEHPFLASLSGKARNSLLAFSNHLAEWHALAQSADPLIMVERILKDVDYQYYVDDGTEEGHDRWENVQELRRLAADRRDKSFAVFLEELALVSDQDTLAEGTVNAPTLLTLHAAKGLEFPVVFLVGLNEGVLPHIRSRDDPEQMKEERRLFYVGMTRAKDRLLLSYYNLRTGQGLPDYPEPSRFVEDIPDELVEGGVDHRPRLGRSGGSFFAPTYRRPYDDEPRWESTSTPRSSNTSRPSRKPAEAAAPQSTTYKAGMRVQHGSFGLGLVLNAKLQDGDELLDIFFEEVGLKRLAASLAKLQIVPKDSSPGG